MKNSNSSTARRRPPATRASSRFVGFFVPDALLSRVDAAAAARGMNRSSAIRAALEKFTSAGAGKEK